MPRQNMEVAMLVIARKQGETIQVGDTIVRVVRLGGRNVRLGIEGPAVVTRPDSKTHAATEPPFGLGLPVEHWSSNRQA